MIIRIAFQPSWVLDASAVNQFAVMRIIRGMRREFGGEHLTIISRGSFDCEAELKGVMDEAEAAAKIRGMAEEISGAPLGTRCRVEIPGTEEKPEAEPGLEEKMRRLMEAAGAVPGEMSPTALPGGLRPDAARDAAFPANRSPEDSVKTAAEEEEGPEVPSGNNGAPDLIGRADFDGLCAEIRRQAPIIRENGTYEVFGRRAYLTAVNTGDGYTTCLNRFARLLKEEGLFPMERAPWEFRMPEPNDDHLTERMAEFRDHVGRVAQTPRVLSFDLEPWMGHTSDPEFSRFLLSLLHLEVPAILFFRIPFTTERIRQEIKEDLEDVFSVRVILCPPFEGEDVRNLARRVLSDFGFYAENGIWERFDRRIEEEKADGRFYGIHTIRKAARDMITLAETGPSGKDVRLVRESDLVNGFLRREGAEESAMNRLRDMVGLDQIKRELGFIVNQILLARTVKDMKAPGMHMRFEGNPGTGKTTVGRLVAQILKEKGVLRTGRLFEHHGRDLCGRYLGETAIKTRRICEEAYGSVLFIDEAYSLYRGESAGYEYGREALDTLVAQMENHSDDLVVILAGYPEDMKTLMSANSGLAARIPYRIVFPDYTREELYRIYIGMMKEHFTVTPELDGHARAFFDSLPDEKLHAKDFGNGRYVRNIFERAWGYSAERNPGTKLTELEVNPADFDEAVKAVDGSDGNRVPKYGYRNA